MKTSIEAPVLANQVLAAASAVFSWAIEEGDIIGITNPCKFVERNETRDRERVLSESEVPKLWKALDGVDQTRAAALRVLLLVGQRPGEVAAMRAEHVVDGAWWQMPGEPIEALGVARAPKTRVPIGYGCRRRRATSSPSCMISGAAEDRLCFSRRSRQAYRQARRCNARDHPQALLRAEGGGATSAPHSRHHYHQAEIGRDAMN